MLDLTPAATATSAVVQALTDDDLDRPTPCDEMTVSDVVAHLDLVAQGFADLARGAAGNPAPPFGSARGTEWRAAVAEALGWLAAAWSVPDRWDGTTDAGVELPNATWGRVALTEVVVHGWDLAVATGQVLDVGEPTLRATLDHVAEFVPAAPIPALWGTPVTLPADAPLLDRVVAATGRDPRRALTNG